MKKAKYGLNKVKPHTYNYDDKEFLHSFPDVISEYEDNSSQQSSGSL